MTAIPTVHLNGTSGQDLPRYTSKTMDTKAFAIGQTYYGSLSCAHNSFPVVCVKRTEKSVWFEHATLSHAYKAARAKVHVWDDGRETAKFHGWYISSDSVKDNGWDLNTI